MTLSPEEKARSWLKRIFNKQGEENVHAHDVGGHAGYAVDCGKLMDSNEGRGRDEVMLGINEAFEKTAPGIGAVAIPLDCISPCHLFLRREPLLDPRAQKVMAKSLEVLEMLAQRHAHTQPRPKPAADEPEMSQWELAELLGGWEAVGLLEAAGKPALDPNRVSLPAIALFDLERATGVEWKMADHPDGKYYYTSQPVPDLQDASARLMSAMKLNGRSREGLHGSHAAHMGAKIDRQGHIVLNAKWITATALKNLLDYAANEEKQADREQPTLPQLFSGPAQEKGLSR